MKCHVCKSNNDDGQTVCANCGALLRKKGRTLTNDDTIGLTNLDNNTNKTNENVIAMGGVPEIVLQAPDEKNDNQTLDSLDGNKVESGIESVQVQSEIVVHAPDVLESSGVVPIEPPQIEVDNQQGKTKGFSKYLPMIFAVFVLVIVGYMMIGNGKIGKKPLPNTIEEYIDKSVTPVTLNENGRKHVEKFTVDFFQRALKEDSFSGTAYSANTEKLQNEYNRVADTFKKNKINSIKINEGKVADVVKLNENSLICSYRFKSDISYSKKYSAVYKCYIDTIMEVKNKELLVVEIRKWDMIPEKK